MGKQAGPRCLTLAVVLAVIFMAGHVTAGQQAGMDHFDLYKKASDLFAAGKFEEGRGLLEELLKRPDLPEKVREDAMRKAADCNWNLGDDRSLQKAAQLYKTILSSYPGEADFVRFRLAKTYERLSYHQAAAEEFAEVAVRYPKSPYGEEALFQAGVMAERGGRLERAIDEYRLYLFRHPNGKFAKTAYFTVGDCYFRLGQRINAELWFRTAQKRWSDVEDLPPQIMVNLGVHNYHMGRYAEAVAIFTLYASLYPKDPSAPHLLYSAAHGLARMEQLPSAMRFLGHLSERYAAKREGRDSAVSLVDIAAQRGRMKLPVIFAALDCRRDPLMAYDHLLGQYPRGELFEYLLLRKGRVHLEAGHPDEALRALAFLLSSNPKSAHAAEARENLKAATARLAAQYEKKGDHLAIADLYFRAYGRFGLGCDDPGLCYRMARSLVETGLNKEASSLIQELSRKEGDAAHRASLTLLAAEMVRREGDLGQAEALLKQLLADEGGQASSISLRAKRDLARIYFRRGDWEAVVALYADLPAGGTVMTALDHHLYARALQQTRRFGRALVHYRLAADALKNNPGSAHSDAILVESYMGMGESLYGERNFSLGVKMYEQALAGLKDDGDKWWAKLRIGQGYVRQNNPEQGVKFMEEAKAKAPEDPFVAKVIETLRVSSEDTRRSQR